MLVVAAGSAVFDEVEDMNAAFATLKGWRAVIGLAVFGVLAPARHGANSNGLPRSANAVACRVVENMAAIEHGSGEKGREERV